MAFLGYAEFPELSHIELPAPDDAYFVTVGGRVGTIFRMLLVDLEEPEFLSRFEAYSHHLARLKPGVTAKWILRTVQIHEAVGNGSRKEAIACLGWTRKELWIVLETSPRVSTFARILKQPFQGKAHSSFEKEILFLKQSGDFEFLTEQGAKRCGEDEIRAFFPHSQSEPLQTRTGLETGTDHVGVVRLWRQGVNALEPSTLALMCERIPPPYEIVVQLRKLPEVRSQYILQRMHGQKAHSVQSTAARGLETADRLLEETLLSGKSMVEIEWLLVLKRPSEETLKTDTAKSLRILESLGDLLAEVQGVLPSYVATFPGAEPHHLFLELDETATYYLPVFTRGEAQTDTMPELRALSLHRRDGSLYHFDLFRKGYDGANCLINGRRGKGKSVLANLISTSLLQDPSVRLIKVDVGGSYVKECELYQGQHIQFNLSEPSGLNPFALLGQTELMEDASVIVAGFLSTLILDGKETLLSKEIQSAVEKAVLAYAEARRQQASLEDFLTFSKDLPRRSLLERFSAGGIFSNVLKDKDNNAGILGSRYVYFNFERLQNAANEDFAQAVMAAVIASVNLEVLRAGDARRGAKNRVVFFADETPFFIQRNGRFFKLTTANFRKFGHGTILIAQTTQDFALPKDGGGVDYGILINSPIRFFYQVDDEVNAFRERFGLTNQQTQEIQNLRRFDSYREVFLQDELGGRVLQVAVTPEEYWRVTSSRADNEKLQALLSAVPGLRLEEAIRCLTAE